MTTLQLADTLPPMRNASRGESAEARIDALGADKQDVAKLANVSRNTLYRALSGVETVEEKTWRKIETALDRLEDEAQGGAEAVLSTEAGLIEFEVTGDFGVRVIVKGPIENADQLEASVARLIRDIRDGNSDRSD